MNSLTIIGNLTKAPELRHTSDGIPVCSFTVAVNRKQKREGQPDADFFNVTAWRGLAEICAKFLDKGRKVCVVGTVGIHTYTGNDGVSRSNLVVNAADVEFLSPKVSDPQDSPAVDQQTGYTAVETDELPFV